MLYGNRSYGSALYELSKICKKCNMINIGAGAFVGEHSFSNILAKNRPDKEDLKIINYFANEIIKKINNFSNSNININIKKENLENYYKPKYYDGSIIEFKNFKPKVSEYCNNCKKCVYICPMNSISYENVSKYTSICIKCCSCIKKCPRKARYFDDKGYIYHKLELESTYTDRADIKLYY